MITLLRSDLQQAKILHVCTACLGWIKPGDRYLAQFMVDYGDHWMWKSHQLCDFLYWRLWREQGLCGEDIVEPHDIRDSLVEFFSCFDLGRVHG